MKALPATPYVANEITGFVEAGERGKLIAVSGEIGMYGMKLRRKESVGIAMIVNNEGRGEIEGKTSVTVDVQGTPEIQVEIHSAAGITPEGGTKMSMNGRLPTKITIFGIIKAHIRQTGIIGGGSGGQGVVFLVNGQLIVEEKKQTTTIPWSVPIRMTDFIRPVKMTTKQVGEIWGKHSQEKKVDLRIVDDDDDVDVDWKMPQMNQVTKDLPLHCHVIVVVVVVVFLLELHFVLQLLLLLLLKQKLFHFHHQRVPLQVLLFFVLLLSFVLQQEKKKGEGKK